MAPAAAGLLHDVREDECATGVPVLMGRRPTSSKLESDGECRGGAALAENNVSEATASESGNFKDMAAARGVDAGLGSVVSRGVGAAGLLRGT